MRTLISTSRPKLDCRLAACAVALICCLIAVTRAEGAVEAARAPAMSEQERFERGLIEVHYPPDYLSPYKERRSSWAPIFGVSYENVVPVGFVSDVLDPQGNSYDYESLFGSAALPLFSYFGGIQFNFSSVSIAPTFGVAMGQVSGGPYETTLRVNLKSAGLTVNLDSIMNEPYVVPTFSLLVNTADYTETAAGVKNSGSTSPFISYTVGALIQLNWLDPSGAFEVLKDSGLNNTFAHVYAGQLLAANGDSTSFSSKLSLGAGVRLEF